MKSYLISHVGWAKRSVPTLSSDGGQSEAYTLASDGGHIAVAILPTLRMCAQYIPVTPEDAGFLRLDFCGCRILKIE